MIQHLLAGQEMAWHTQSIPFHICAARPTSRMLCLPQPKLPKLPKLPNMAGIKMGADRWSVYDLYDIAT